MNMQKFKNVFAASGIAGLGLVSSGAQAAGVDLSTLTAAVDVSTVVPAILAVAAILIGVGVAIYAVRKVRGMLPK